MPFFVSMRYLALAVAAVAALLGSAPLTAGELVPIGGALRADNAAIWGRLIESSGSRGARWVVLPIASSAPEQAGREAAATLARYGAAAEFLPLSPLLTGRDAARDAHDPALVAKIDAAQGVFFTGGAQERITATLLQTDGGDTPLLAALRRLQTRGGVIAGTSAGAAMMPRIMIRDIPDQLPVMRAGAAMGRDIDRGLALAPAELFVDQHCLARGRIGRLLAVMAQQKYPLGICVEENAAAFIRGGMLAAAGAAPLVVVDLRAAEVADAPLAVRGGIAHVLDPGDRYDLAAHRVLPSAGKEARRLDPAAPGFSPYYAGVPFYADLLGDRVIVNALTTLLDSREPEARGLAFRVAAATAGAAEAGTETKEVAERERLGFEFRFYKRTGTHGYAPRSSEGAGYTVIGMGFDVAPVTMAQPLYRRRAAGAWSDRGFPAKTGENVTFDPPDKGTPK